MPSRGGPLGLSNPVEPTPLAGSLLVAKPKAPLAGSLLDVKPKGPPGLPPALAGESSTDLENPRVDEASSVGLGAAWFAESAEAITATCVFLVESQVA